MRGLVMLPRSLLLKIPNNGLWSTEMIRSVHPSVNVLECLRDQHNAKASPSVGEYRLSVGVVKRDPAKIKFHPVGQHVGGS